MRQREEEERGGISFSVVKNARLKAFIKHNFKTCKNTLRRRGPPLNVVAQIKSFQNKVLHEM